MNECLIRNVEIEDIRDITDIYNYYITHSTATFETQNVSIDEMLNRIENIKGHYPFLVCIQGNRLVGYAYAHLWKEKSAYNRTWETSIYLHPDYIGYGIGTLLMQRLIDECLKLSAKVLIACITAENQSSIAFHKNLGFKQVSHFSQVGYKFSRWLDIIDMQLILENPHNE